ncbi:alpha/beta hydrolase [Coniochaeta ligniaria NRRL 30616]|uniref:Alpha/beta hydrolase n=1 Tax=Coniochaeta ligniaria NRRL 30616 TaxID=1408157 RepID=A0A1J7I5G2_9PEZI|nr:alpha/beta hydrolase [Coniochaeta ligniaria NRRL 30616]
MPFIDVNNKSLFYTLSSPPPSSTHPNPAFTILCIHGLGSSSSFYAPITSPLTSLGHTVVAIDTHGSGLSPYVGTGNTTTSIADDALALLSALRDGVPVPKDVIILGHSMGAIVASELALKDDDHQQESRIRGLVLIGPVHPNPGAAGVFAGRIEIVARDGMEPLALSVPVSATGSKASPVAQTLIRTLLLGSDPAGYISLCRAIAEARVPDYEGVRVPVLIIVGDEDKSAPMEGSRLILERYGSARKEMRVLRGVGHWHVLEAYEEVARMVGEFVGGVST